MKTRAVIGRWYRRGRQVRMPYKVTDRVVYRERRCSSGCSAAGWFRWAAAAEMMPEGWEPEGHDGWAPP